jgi:hypothetical protein
MMRETNQNALVFKEHLCSVVAVCVESLRQTGIILMEILATMI